MELYTQWLNADTDFLERGYTIAHLNDVWEECSFSEKARFFVLHKVWQLSQDHYEERLRLLPAATKALEQLSIEILNVAFIKKSKSGYIVQYEALKENVLPSWDALSHRKAATNGTIFEMGSC